MKPERGTGTKHRTRSISRTDPPGNGQEEDGLKGMRIIPLSVKAAASFQVWALTSQHGQGRGAPMTMASISPEVGLYWLPVLFVDSAIVNDTPSEEDHLKGCHENHNLEPGRNEVMRLTEKTLPAVEHSRYIYGPLVLDASRHEVYVNGHETELTRKEFGLLEYFLRHPGYVRTRELLLNTVWGYDYHGTTRTVDVHIRRLKQKIPLLNRAIVNVRGLGYKLTDRVHLGPR